MSLREGGGKSMCAITGRPSSCATSIASSSGNDAVALAGVAPDPDLDADDQIAVALRHLEAFARIQQAHVAALADHDRLREGEDAGEGDVEVGQDADRRCAR